MVRQYWWRRWRPGDNTGFWFLIIMIANFHPHLSSLSSCTQRFASWLYFFRPCPIRRHFRVTFTDCLYAYGRELSSLSIHTRREICAVYRGHTSLYLPHSMYYHLWVAFTECIFPTASLCPAPPTKRLWLRLAMYQYTHSSSRVLPLKHTPCSTRNFPTNFQCKQA